MMIDLAMAVRFPAGSNLRSSVAVPYFRSIWSSDGASSTSHRICGPGGCNILWQRCRRLSSVERRSLVKSRVRGCMQPSGSASRYHPSEDFAESTSESCGDARLPAPVIAKTIIEVNNEATLLFPEINDDETIEESEQSGLWPELHYVTDEHGNVYFQVNNDNDFFQNLTSETESDTVVVIGLDTMDVVHYLELSNNNLGTDEIEDEDDGDDDDDDEEDDEDEDDEEEEEEAEDEDWVSILEDLERFDAPIEAPDDWAKLETMRKTHPLFFARRLTEAATDDLVDMMEQPAAGLAIQGLLRLAFIDKHSVIKRHIAGLPSSKADIDKIEEVVEDKLEDSGMINGQPGSSKILPDELENYETPTNGTSFYKLEMTKITLLSAYGHPTVVEIEDFAKAQPDSIGHSAAKIISCLNADGEKTVQALKSLCWRCKGIQVEEATLVGVDSLGFDVRVCSGTQIQTLRFSFGTQATSEYSAKRQLNDLLFLRSHHMPQKRKQTYQNEC